MSALAFHGARGKKRPSLFPSFLFFSLRLVFVRTCASHHGHCGCECQSCRYEYAGDAISFGLAMDQSLCGLVELLLLHQIRWDVHAHRGVWTNEPETRRGVGMHGMEQPSSIDVRDFDGNNPRYRCLHGHLKRRTKGTNRCRMEDPSMLTVRLCHHGLGLTTSIPPCLG